MYDPKGLRDDILAATVPAGQAAYWWLGQHGWVIKSSRLIIGIDIYLTDDARRLIEPALEPVACDFFDVLLTTHEHRDHFDPTLLEPAGRIAPKTVLVAPAHLAERAAAMGFVGERFVGTTGDSSHILRNGLAVTSIPAAHEFLERRDGTGYVAQGYLVTIDGVTIYHSGDSCVYEGLLTRLRAFAESTDASADGKARGIDLMILPINGRDGRRYRRNCLGNMTFQEAADLAGSVRPRLALPSHYGTFAYNTADVNEFIDFVSAKYPRQATRACRFAMRNVLVADRPSA